VGFSVYPSIAASQQLDKHILMGERRIGGVDFYVVCVLSKKNRPLISPRTSCLLSLLCSCLHFPIFLSFPSSVCLLLCFVLLLCCPSNRTRTCLSKSCVLYLIQSLFRCIRVFYAVDIVSYIAKESNLLRLFLSYLYICVLLAYFPKTGFCDFPPICVPT
jgi:hypothetical protein